MPLGAGELDLGPAEQGGGPLGVPGHPGKVLLLRWCRLNNRGVDLSTVDLFYWTTIYLLI